MKLKLLAVLWFVLSHSQGFAAIDYFYIKKSDGSRITVRLEDLKSLPESSFKTSTAYTPEETFVGVSFADFAKKYAITGNTLRAYAWDDYAYSMPVAELYRYQVIIAWKRNGQMMSLSTLGPFALVYPRDQNPELNDMEVDAKTVWQLKELEIK